MAIRHLRNCVSLISVISHGSCSRRPPGPTELLGSAALDGNMDHMDSFLSSQSRVLSN